MKFTATTVSLRDEDAEIDNFLKALGFSEDDVKSEYRRLVCDLNGGVMRRMSAMSWAERKKDERAGLSVQPS